MIALLSPWVMPIFSIRSSLLLWGYFWTQWNAFMPCTSFQPHSCSNSVLLWITGYPGDWSFYSMRFLCNYNYLCRVLLHQVLPGNLTPFHKTVYLGKNFRPHSWHSEAMMYYGFSVLRAPIISIRVRRYLQCKWGLPEPNRNHIGEHCPNHDK